MQLLSDIYPPEETSIGVGTKLRRVNDPVTVQYVVCPVYDQPNVVWLLNPLSGNCWAHSKITVANPFMLTRNEVMTLVGGRDLELWEVV